MIVFQDVTKIYLSPEKKQIIALDNFNLTIFDKEMLCLIGTSGCGKTTALKLVNRLIEPTNGSITMNNQNIADLPVIPLRRQIGYVVQSTGLFPHMTVEQNIGLLAKMSRWKPDKIKERVEILLDLIDLNGYQTRYPKELSGGQQQRVGVARALMLDPDIVLMDEPFGALDPITKKQLHSEFLQLMRQVKKTIIMVTHDINEAFLLGNRIALMDKGKVIQVDDKDGFYHRPVNDFVSQFINTNLTK